MKRNCVILSAAPVSAEMRQYVDPARDYLIACDAGWKSAARLGLQPDLVIGDFDSSPRPQEQQVIVLPHEKDDTDTQYAAAQALSGGYESVRLLGALGGARIEHTLANLSTGLWLEQRGVRAELLSEQSRVTYVRPGETRKYNTEKYFYFSVFACSETAEGVTIRGAAYPLENASLEAAYPIGVSNEFAGTRVEISVRRGFLQVIETVRDF